MGRLGMVKDLLRGEILSKRNNLSEDIVRQKSEKIRDRLVSLDVFKRSAAILLYFSKDKEVDTKGLIANLLINKNVVLPRVNQDELVIARIRGFSDIEPGAFGVLEPKSSCQLFDKESLDLVIVPGVVFDEKGNRIGYGKGYYDRFLKDIKCAKIGLAYEFQVAETLKTASHDVKMDMIVTEERVIDCK